MTTVLYSLANTTISKYGSSCKTNADALDSIDNYRVHNTRSQICRARKALRTREQGLRSERTGPDFAQCIDLVSSWGFSDAFLKTKRMLWERTDAPHQPVLSIGSRLALYQQNALLLNFALVDLGSSRQPGVRLTLLVSVCQQAPKGSQMEKHIRNQS